MTEEIDLKKAMFEDLGYLRYQWQERPTWIDELIDSLISKGWVKKL